jgi:hypothetical protein
MRPGIMFILISILMNGCNPIEQANREAERQQAVKDNLKQIEDELRRTAPTSDNKSAEKSAEKSSGEFTHTITTQTEYYTTGPQQGRPADGKLAADTAVNIVRQAGSYTLVETPDGVQAYVAADAIKPR